MKFISLALALVLIALQYQIWLGNGGLKFQHEAMKQKARHMQQHNKQLSARNQELKAEVDDLKNGYEAISEIARSQYKFIQAGETYYKIQ
ncbi:septum formation initiator family protein [Alysiella filiformis]|uniref:Cell division protein FtsB n=1 Tax=Alysiella filiformis DSM 16848 TaxID=1120981 RepID=A0A286ECB6_9NEIS|nr:septum formation initiator family protein [Alysiella filiformis]QMT30602.1 septum formation initiator family protein [Alysiella filiformis]UBQ56420.1 septum formation initiator family protein [Alysiella filiformis DSM 16848]SOD68520.1 cell division protein FtsB [Alysiella filiformis DSM 16848]